MYLVDLKPGEKGRVRNMAAIEKRFRHRLMDMGIYPGSIVTVVRTLTQGSMYLIEVDDVEICIRKEDAKMIEVRNK